MKCWLENLMKSSETLRVTRHFLNQQCSLEGGAPVKDVYNTVRGRAKRRKGKIEEQI